MTPATPASGNLPVLRLHSRSIPADSAAIPTPEGMPLDDERQVMGWVTDAVAILCRRAAGSQSAELNLRRGLAAIVRHIATIAPPVNDGSGSAQPEEPELSGADLYNIVQALDACLAILARHEHRLTTAQRRIQILARACRRNADEAARANDSGVPFWRRTRVA